MQKLDSVTNSSEKAPVEQSVEKSPRRGLVLWACLATLAAWVFLPLVVWCSIALAVSGIVLAAFGLRGTKGSRRNWAITAIVACSVLLLVFATFWIVLDCVVPNI